jgi:hypothetical protein
MEEERRHLEQDSNTYFKMPGGYLKGLVKDEMEFQLRRMI